MYAPYNIVVNTLLPTVVMGSAYARMGYMLYHSEFASKDKKQAQINMFETCLLSTRTLKIKIKSGNLMKERILHAPMVFLHVNWSFYMCLCIYYMSKPTLTIKLQHNLKF